MTKTINLVGARFEKLVVLRFAGRAKNGHSQWLCACDCGKQIVASRSNLMAGRYLSCGCVKKQRLGALNRTHGASKTRLYSIYCNMISRTENPNVPCFSFYGGRGIKMCATWRENFSVFAKWAQENGYAYDLSIDRIDNDRGYDPENCRWVDHKSQCNNRRSNVTFDIAGQSKSISEWAESYGICVDTVRTRLKAGWSVEVALTTPVKKKVIL